MNGRTDKPGMGKWLLQIVAENKSVPFLENKSVPFLAFYRFLHLNLSINMNARTHTPGFGEWLSQVVDENRSVPSYTLMPEESTG
jgi:hypothetical protein